MVDGRKVDGAGARALDVLEGCVVEGDDVHRSEI